MHFPMSDDGHVISCYSLDGFMAFCSACVCARAVWLQSLSPTHMDTFSASIRSKNNNRYYSEFLDGTSNFFHLYTWSPKHDPHSFTQPKWRDHGSRCDNWQELFPAFYNEANKHKMITKVLFLQLVAIISVSQIFYSKIKISH